MFKPKSKLLVMTLALAVGCAAAFLPVRASAQECAEARAWVEANANQLPTVYAEFARYSMTYRKAIFSSLSPEARSELWKQHYKQYLDAHPDLNKAQVEFIQEALAALSPALFTKSAAPASGNTVQATLKEKATALFGAEEARRLLATLGPPEQREGSVADANCSCSTASDYCYPLTFCTLGTSCTYTAWGCGTNWVYACNGDCLY
ncbi:MAG: hypothetical protein EOO70_01130 [Myxococcaceae bacterium]|nr:MAG: hypothetical protein EOO70_01130 [Myxococcaceae bacterium]